MTAALLATAACGGSTQGQSASTTTSPSHGALPKDPCSLLSQSETTQLGARSAGKAATDLAGYPDCQWAIGQAILDVTEFTNKGVSKLRPTGPTASLGMIGSHQAELMFDTQLNGECSVILAVSSTSAVMVDVQDPRGTPTAQVCTYAKPIAAAVEKHLPS